MSEWKPIYPSSCDYSENHAVRHEIHCKGSEGLRILTKYAEIGGSKPGIWGRRTAKLDFTLLFIPFLNHKARCGYGDSKDFSFGREGEYRIAVDSSYKRQTRTIFVQPAPVWILFAFD